MRILFLSPRQCWPAVTGAKLRELHFLRALGERAVVSYVFYADPGAPALTKTELPFCEAVVPVPKPRMYTPAKVLRGVLGNRPLPIVNYTSPGMHAALAKLLQSGQFDVAHFDSIHMAGFESLLPSRSPVVYDWHNIESEAMQRYAGVAAGYPARLYASITARRLAALEGKILRCSAGHLVCSERERQQLERIAPAARVAVIENGVDTEHYRGAGGKTEDLRRLVFVGSMSYHANADCMTGFAREEWPRIRERFPHWRLTIVGSSPTREVLALASLPGVEVTGTVPDVRPYYADAVASIVPLRTGGGTRLKILESMAAGVPVVSTAIGAEGLSVTPGKEFLLADRGDWVAALELLADNRAAREKMIAAALELVQGSYDWNTLGANLYSTYLGWFGKENSIL